MKTTCGHDEVDWKYGLSCGECEVFQRQLEDDALWNAAIEAACALAEHESHVANVGTAEPYWEGRKMAADKLHRLIVALKREAK